MKTKILITTANGKTGKETVKQLIAMGYQVRAMVHKIDDRSIEIKKLGAEIVEGDLLSLKSVKSALQGIESAYFCFPFIEGLLEGATNFAIAGKEVNLKRLVNMSQKNSYENHKSPATRQHWLSERILDWANIGAVHILPTLFSSNILRMVGNSVVTEGKMYLPFGEGKHAPVSYEDIAAVISNLLIDKGEKHTGKKYVITGPKEYTIHQFAEIVGDKIGKQVEYINIPVDAWGKALSELPFMNPHFIAHLKQVAKDVQNGVFEGVTNIVKTIGGREPETFEHFLDNNLNPFLEITTFNN